MSDAPTLFFSFDIQSPDDGNTITIEDVVNQYWQKHYRDEDGKCKICWDIGEIDTGEWCICPEGMKMRKQSEV